MKTSFESLESEWILQENEKARDILNRTFEFAVRTVKLCSVLDQAPGAPRTMAAQLLRAGTSIGANLEEAQAAESRADFLSKMRIALKEARETSFRLRILSAAGIGKSEDVLPLVAEAGEIAKVLGAIIVSTKRDQTSS